MLDLITWNRVEAWHNSATMARDLLFGRYPSFVYGRSSRADEMPPIFCFHSAEPNSFESLLQFLKNNGYNTIDCDDYYEMLTSDKKLENSRSIMLTFDDGVRQVWSVVYPLLKKYNMKAVVFLIPGRIREAKGGLLSNLADTWEGRASIEEIVNRDQSDQPLATWQEIAVMHKSGIMDFQSHTFLHNRIFTGDKVVDFVNPDLIRKIHPHRLTMCEDHSKMESSYSNPPLGAPLYRSAPRMAGKLSIKENNKVSVACVNYVEQRGGKKFFKNHTWKKELFDFYKRNIKCRLQKEDLDEQQNIITEDLLKARNIIENKLPGKRVRHLAYPWGIGSDIAERIAEKVGYVSCYWGRVDGRLTNSRRDNPYRLARVGEDFIKLLEGNGQLRLINVISKKFLKNFRF